jgi:hypothetical protein
LERLDGIFQELYACTFHEFKSKLFRLAYNNGFDEGLQKGGRLGFRVAKGRKGEPKELGRPPKIDSSIRTLLMVHVDREREKGKPVKEAIAEFLEIMQRGAESLEASSASLPTEARASQVYYRDRKKKPRDRKRKHP